MNTIPKAIWIIKLFYWKMRLGSLPSKSLNIFLSPLEFFPNFSINLWFWCKRILNRIHEVTLCKFPWLISVGWMIAIQLEITRGIPSKCCEMCGNHRVIRANFHSDFKWENLSSFQQSFNDIISPTFLLTSFVHWKYGTWN